MNSTHEVPVRFIFEGTCTVEASSPQEATKICDAGFGLGSDGQLHRVDDRIVGWCFPAHPVREAIPPPRQCWAFATDDCCGTRVNVLWNREDAKTAVCDWVENENQNPEVANTLRGLEFESADWATAWDDWYDTSRDPCNTCTLECFEVPGVVSKPPVI